MSQLANQFSQNPVQGQLFNAPAAGNGNIITVKLNLNSINTIKGGSPVYLDNTALYQGGSQFYVDLADSTRQPLGFATYNIKKNDFTPGGQFEVAFDNCFMWLTAGGTIAYGDDLMINPTNSNQVVTWIANNNYYKIGTAMMSAISGDLFVVRIKVLNLSDSNAVSILGTTNQIDVSSLDSVYTVSLPTKIQLSGVTEVTGFDLFSAAGGSGFVSNGSGSAYNAIPSLTNGIYLTNSDFYITSNLGSGVVYSSIFHLVNANGNLTILGTLNAGNGADITGAVRISDTLSVISTSQFQNTLTITAGGLSVTGNSTFNNDVTVLDATLKVPIIAAQSTAAFTIIAPDNVTRLSMSSVANSGVDILGRTTGSEPSAGYVGYLQADNTDQGSPITLTDGIYSTLATIILPAGNYMASGMIVIDANSATGTTLIMTGGISADATNGSDLVPGMTAFDTTYRNGVTNLGFITFTLPPNPINLSAPATYYLIVNAQFSGTCAAYGGMTIVQTS